MAERRHYSRKDKTRTVGIATVEGQREAARQTGVPLTTVHQWFHDPEFEQLRTAKKDEVEQGLWIGVQVGLKAVVDSLLDEKDLGKKATAFGILFDKHALMTGEVTSRTEQRAITQEFPDEEKAKLRDAIDRILNPQEVDG